MSLILDALQRAQRERGAPAGDALTPDSSEAMDAAARADHAGGAGPWRSAWVRWLATSLLLSLLLLLVLLFALLFERWRGSVPSATQSLPAVKPAVRDVAAGTPPASPPRSDPATTVAQRAPPSDVTTEVRETPETRDDLNPMPVADPFAAEVAALYAAEPALEASPEPWSGSGSGSGSKPKPEDETEQATLDVAALSAMAEAELGAAPLAEHPVPLLDTFSKQQKDAIPTLIYLQHDYRADGGSQVLLNRQLCVEGDTVSGVRVEQILPDSVVLRRGETTFRLRALNSWVNL